MVTGHGFNNQIGKRSALFFYSRFAFGYVRKVPIDFPDLEIGIEAGPLNASGYHFQPPVMVKIGESIEPGGFPRLFERPLCIMLHNHLFLLFRRHLRNRRWHGGSSRGGGLGRAPATEQSKQKKNKQQ